LWSYHLSIQISNTQGYPLHPPQAAAEQARQSMAYVSEASTRQQQQGAAHNSTSRKHEERHQPCYLLLPPSGLTEAEEGSSCSFTLGMESEVQGSTFAAYGSVGVDQGKAEAWPCQQQANSAPFKQGGGVWEHTLDLSAHKVSAPPQAVLKEMKQAGFSGGSYCPYHDLSSNGGHFSDVRDQQRVLAPSRLLNGLASLSSVKRTDRYNR
jgi:hypothetical protein